MSDTDPIAVILSYVFIGLLAITNLAFLVNWINERDSAREFRRPGWLLAGLTIVLAGIGLAFGYGTGMRYWSAASFLAIPQLLIGATRLMGFSTLGMLCATGQGYPSAPLLLRWLGAKRKPVLEAAAIEIDAGDAPDLATSDTSRLTSPKPDLLHNVPWYEYLLVIVLVVAFNMLWSYFVYILAGLDLRTIMDIYVDPSYYDNGVIMMLALVLLAAVLEEEIVFRLGFQTVVAEWLHLDKKRYWVAILFASLFWMLGHTGSAAPLWAKFLQIFPLGLTLGWLYQKRGIESTILAHGLFNFVMAGWVLLAVVP